MQRLLGIDEEPDIKIHLFFPIVILFSQLSFANDVQINCDLKLLNANRELDNSLQQPLIKNFFELLEKSPEQMASKKEFFDNTGGPRAVCNYRDMVGWHKIYDKNGTIEIRLVNPRTFHKVCMADSRREKWHEGKIPFTVSTTIDMNNPPERFRLVLPTPNGLGISDDRTAADGANVRFLQLDCRQVK